MVKSTSQLLSFLVARIWKKELDRMTSDLSATRKLGGEASEKLSETQQSLTSLESAISQEKAQSNLLTKQLEQSLGEFRELRNQLEGLASMKEENKKLEMEVLRLDATLRVSTFSMLLVCLVAK